MYIAKNYNGNWKLADGLLDDKRNRIPILPSNGRPEGLAGELTIAWLPHAGGSSEEGIRRVGEGSAEQMAWLAEGYWPRHVANPGVQPRAPLRRRGYPERG